MAIQIRTMRKRDIPGLAAIRATFVSPTVLRVRKRIFDIQVTWELIEEVLPEPYDKREAYNLTPRDLEEISSRLSRKDCLEWVAEDDGKLVALYDLETMAWNNTGWLWNLLVDVDYRRRRLGSRLFSKGIEWARKRNLRAIIIETQTNNVPACRFYVNRGCHVVGINDHYYTNHDLELGEVAVFFSYDLSDTAPDAFTRPA